MKNLLQPAGGLALALALSAAPAFASDDCPVGSLCYSAPSLWVGDAVVTEGTGAGSVLSFTVSRTGDTSDAISFGVYTSPGTANPAALGDYLPLLPGVRAVLPAGATEMTVEVPVTGDATFEPDEQLQLTIDTAYAAGAVSMMDALNWYDVGDDPAGLVFQDLDGDGLPELVTGDTSDGTLSILSNTGGLGMTSYDSRRVYAVGQEPWAIAAGDLDGDGNPDLVAADRAGNSVEILLHDADPASLQFASARAFAVGAAPSGLALGDVDGDGRLDVLTADALGGISVLRNTSTPGQLSFAPAASWLAGLGPRALALGDLDGDGKLDVAVATVGGLVEVLRNIGSAGSPGFSAPLPLAAVSTLLSLVIADFDGDGRADIAAPNSGFLGNTVSVFLNTGALAVPSFADALSFDVGQAPYFIAAGDVNGDGRADLVTGNAADGTVSVLRNFAIAGQADFADAVTYATGGSPYGVALGDANGDGQLDIAAACAGDNVVAIVRNNLPTVMAWVPTGLGTILNDDIAPAPQQGGAASGGSSGGMLLGVLGLAALLRRRSK